MGLIKIWEYDPTHLDDEQLSFELMIRGIMHYKERREKIKVLCKQLLNERYGQKTDITVDNLDPEFEIKTCEEAAIDLTDRIGKSLYEKDITEFYMVSSQAAFYYNRLNLVADRKNPNFIKTLSRFVSIENMLNDVRRNKKDMAQQQSRPISPTLYCLERTQELLTIDEIMRQYNEIISSDQTVSIFGYGREAQVRTDVYDQWYATVTIDSFIPIKNEETINTESTENEESSNWFYKSIENGLVEQIHNIKVIENVPDNHRKTQDNEGIRDGEYQKFGDKGNGEQNKNLQIRTNQFIYVQQQQSPEMYNGLHDMRAIDKRYLDNRYQRRIQYPYSEKNLFISCDGQRFSLTDFFSRIELSVRAKFVTITNDQLFLKFNNLLSRETKNCFSRNYRVFCDLAGKTFGSLQFDNLRKW